MKGKYLIAIAFLASWTVITATKLPAIFGEEDEEVEVCPAKDICPPKLISHESDCSKYYECSNGRKQLRSCSAGLYFSLKWRGCVNWEISDCIPSPPTPPPIPPPTTTPPRDIQCINGDLLPHECNCTNFYECINGRKALRYCPPDHHFDPPTKACVPGEDCVPGECLNGDAKRHECDCDKYYKCNNDEWFLEYCKNGEHFNEARKTCTNPIEARCDDTIPDDCSVNGVLLPHECQCTQYYECVNGNKALRQCPTNWHFDPLRRNCEPGTCVNKARKRLH